jgi:hypothetical protein
MKYGVEMGSDVMVYTPDFIKTGSGIQKLIGSDSQTYRQHGGRINLFSLRLTHSLTRGAENFLRSCQLCSHSRTSQFYGTRRFINTVTNNPKKEAV